MMIGKRARVILFFHCPLFVISILFGAGQVREVTVPLAGQVLLEDGAPPLGPLRVILDCGRRISQEAFTSPSGIFFFQVDIEPGPARLESGAPEDRPGFSEKPPISSRSNLVDLSDCEVHLAGRFEHRANAIRLGPRSSFDDPDIGSIVIHQIVRPVETTVSLDVLRISPSARELFKKAIDELSATSPDSGKAARLLEVALESCPKVAAGWELLGEVRLQQKDRHGARQAFERAITVDRAYSRPYLSLSRLDLYEEKWREAAKHSRFVLDMNTSCPRAFHFNGVANYFLGRLAEAERSFLRLQETGFLERYAVDLFYLGMIRVRRGCYDDAAAILQRYLELMPREEMPAGQYEWLRAQLDRWESTQ